MKTIWLYLLLLLPFSTKAVSPPPVTAKHAMVVTDQALASQAGLAILKAGGNAVDAAVAVGYALAVVNPCCGNIGGGGFMLIRYPNDKAVFLNFRERAPLAATPTLFSTHPDAEKLSPYLSVAVPGTVLGLDTALSHYGTMTRQQVMAPAIKLAEQGFILRPGDDKYLTQFTDDFRQQPNVAAIFLKPDLTPWQVGDRLIQKDLAATLKQIAQQGPRVFYRGDIAHRIVKASETQGGILTLNDFKHYYVEERKPITCHYRGYAILSSPPPSSGGTTLCEILNILEHYPLSTDGFHTATTIHHMIEAMRFSFYDRNNKLGDPDFVSNPIAHLLSKKYAAAIYRRIKENHRTPASEFGTITRSHEKQNTTHYSIIDKEGNAVAVTYTINGAFGAKVIAGNTGFFLNNQMDDFSKTPGIADPNGLVQSDKNNIQSGKRPLSSMAPTIITRDHQLFMVTGSPGGPRIITITLQTILNVIDFGMTIQEAVDAPRFHHQFTPDAVDVEPFVFSTDTKDKLSKMGYQFTPVNPWGAAEAIYVDPQTRQLKGGCDHRRPAGEAVGY
ncbi:MAG: gamma-glutamyltransferase [Gammaproteobacteria bacterium RIFCSPHIGHO2_12_FULL_45_12]|nr:MAG: gamma-glutamyltransferase [Gammaproteobacteria bacterium RIFCSPHIGHO2_12_FULL_45_12]